MKKLKLSFENINLYEYISNLFIREVKIALPLIKCEIN